jgi:hypothetical protein
VLARVARSGIVPDQMVRTIRDNDPGPDAVGYDDAGRVN